MSSCVEPWLPVATISAPPAASTSSSTAVFGSTCSDMPTRRPANGRRSAKSRRAAASSGIRDLIQVVREAPRSRSSDMSSHFHI